METLKVQTNQGEFFYEILRGKDDLKLVGPLPGMFLVEENTQGYAFVQILNGSPKVAFTKSEILVTNRAL